MEPKANLAEELQQMQSEQKRMDAPLTIEVIHKAIQDSDHTRRRPGKTGQGMVSPPTVLTEQQIPGAICHLIEDAQSHVSMCFYKFNGSSPAGQKFYESLRTLQQKATQEQRYVDVRMLINRRGKGAALVYRNNVDTGLEKLVEELNNEYFQLTVAFHITNAFDSYHAKSIVVDPYSENPQVIFCSGDIDTVIEPQLHRFETALLITSTNIAVIAHDDFNQAWNQHYQASASGSREEPQLPSQKRPQPLSSTSKMLTLQQQAVLREVPLEDSRPALYMRSKPHSNIITDQGWPPFKIALITSIQQAGQTINIINPNLNDPDIIKALADAINRGVSVNIAMGKYHNESAERLVGGTNIQTMEKLYKQISPENYKNLHIRWAVNMETYDIVKHGQPYTIHGKFCYIDDKLLMMGSSPLDKQAMRCSREIDLAIELREDEQKDILERVFNEKYYLGRDYHVDLIIDKLKKEYDRLKKLTSDESAQKKAVALEAVIKELSVPGLPLQCAQEILSGEALRESLKVSRRNDGKSQSLITLQECLEICKKISPNDGDEEFIAANYRTRNQQQIFEQQPDNKQETESQHEAKRDNEQTLNPAAEDNAPPVESLSTATTATPVTNTATNIPVTSQGNYKPPTTTTVRNG